MRIALIAALVAVAGVSASADTIVLKNGQRIFASNVTEDAQYVTYETPAGRMSIPKALVVRVEHDEQTYTPAAAASHLGITTPAIAPVPGYEAISKLTVHDNSIDYAYLATLETAARSGSAEATGKVAAAHYVAAQFLIAQGNIDSAIDQYRQALVFAPDNVALLLNLASLELRQSQFEAALEPLEHARDISPASGLQAVIIAKLMGWAYYGSNQPDEAIKEWKLSEQLRPDPEVEQALAKAQKDQTEEADYRDGNSEHFTLKYYGGAAPELAPEILRTLEDEFNDIQSQLDYTPTNQISVILYTQQAFEDITRAPGWVDALYDGRLRIPVQGLSSVTPELAHVLKHELTHAFITQKSDGRAPVWLQEGVAQWMEGKRSTDDASALVDAAEQGTVPNLKSLEGSWMSLSGDSASMAYAWSLAVVESIMQNGGTTDVSRLIEKTATAVTPEDAVREALHCDYNDLQQQTVDYLKSNYLR
ncbi:MAG TPA: tetratricopeptide repeat protein [Candidatus Acidoferrum sp.]|nr:tetratricopeptide repeat protein [Candidatus Acidoferrum sp.]